jgi:Uncharacterised nucleotidyltransferase
MDMTAAQSSGPLDGLFPAMGPWTAAALWHGLAALPVPTTPLEDELRTIHAQRLTPLLLRYLRENDPATMERSGTEIGAASLKWAIRTGAVLQRGALVSTLLDECGIPNAVAKGPSLATLYPALQDRPFADLDIYVHRSRFTEAVEICTAHGWYEAAESRQPRRYFDRHCREAVNLIQPPYGNVDIHHHVPPWYWSKRLTSESLLARSSVVSVMGHSIRTVSPIDNLLIVALHLVSDKNAPGASLLVWRDLAQAWKSAEKDAALERAHDVRLAPWLLSVLRELPDVATPASPTDPPIRSRQAIRSEHRLGHLVSGRTSNAGVIVSQPLRLPIWNAVLYVAGMIYPSRSFLQLRFPVARHRRITWMASRWSGTIL